MYSSIVLMVYLCILAPLAAGAQDDPLPICTTIPEPVCLPATIRVTVTPTPTAVAPVAAWYEVYMPLGLTP